MDALNFRNIITLPSGRKFNTKDYNGGLAKILYVQPDRKGQEITNWNITGFRFDYKLKGNFGHGQHDPPVHIRVFKSKVLIAHPQIPNGIGLFLVKRVWNAQTGGAIWVDNSFYATGETNVYGTTIDHREGWISYDKRDVENFKKGRLDLLPKIVEENTNTGSGTSGNTGSGTSGNTGISHVYQGGAVDMELATDGENGNSNGSIDILDDEGGMNRPTQAGTSTLMKILLAGLIVGAVYMWLKGRKNKAKN